MLPFHLRRKETILLVGGASILYASRSCSCMANAEVSSSDEEMAGEFHVVTFNATSQLSSEPKL
jgi:hypothetical protein